MALRARWFCFGYAVVNFDSLVSLKEWLATRNIELDGLPTDDRFAYVESLAKDPMHQIAGVVPAVPVALIAIVFQQRRIIFLTESEVQVGIMHMMVRFDRDGAITYIPRRDRDCAIRVSNENMQLLNYYVNSIAHLLPKEAA